MTYPHRTLSRTLARGAARQVDPVGTWGTGFDGVLPESAVPGVLLKDLADTTASINDFEDA